jgi:hypothetical protein
VVSVLAVSGFAFLVLCTIGKLGRVGIGPLEADFREDPKEFVENLPRDTLRRLQGEEEAEPLPPGEIGEPVPAGNPVETIRTEEGSLSVYPLTSVPPRVLGDLFSKWPEGQPLPKDLSTFEFALRKEGKGNHPWVVKFAGDDTLLVVSRGKGGPKVNRVAAGGAT